LVPVSCSASVSAGSTASRRTSRPAKEDLSEEARVGDQEAAPVATGICLHGICLLPGCRWLEPLELPGPVGGRPVGGRPVAAPADSLPPWWRLSGHSEAIVTSDLAAATRFTTEVDAAAVLVNASTRFVDGERFGFGAEIGISTQKLHARGPMGLRELTTTKYVVHGDGHVVA
jgi:hypothetical protein